MVKLHHVKQWVEEKFLYDDLSEEEYISADVKDAGDGHTLIVSCTDESGDKSKFAITIMSLD